MGGKPSRGTPADQRLRENSSPDSTDDSDTTVDTSDSETADDAPGGYYYNTYMPWAN